jgi:hypothetical protein
MVSQNERVIRPRSPIERYFAGLHRFRYLLAPVSFGIGLGSFLLIQRAPWIAQWLAVLLLVTWLVSVLELTVPRKAPPALLRFITQQTHQEAFFFTLPFFLKTTNWLSTQAIFTGGVMAAALASMWDPLYFGVIAKRRWLYLAFHALAVYLVVLVSLPLLLRLTTTQSLALAAIAVALIAAPSLGDVPDRQPGPSGWLLFVGALVLAAFAWFGRANVPSPTLWVSDAAITAEMDVANRRPVERINAMTVRRAQEHGVYAFTAITAPRGLREKIFHVWQTPGQPDVAIALQISGGREQGYRAWTHKTGFNEPGRWRVRVVTQSGQRIGELEFEVVANSAPEAIQRYVPQPQEKREPEVEPVIEQVPTVEAAAPAEPPPTSVPAAEEKPVDAPAEMPMDERNPPFEDAPMEVPPPEPAVDSQVPAAQEPPAEMPRSPPPVPAEVEPAPAAGSPGVEETEEEDDGDAADEGEATAAEPGIAEPDLVPAP